MDLSWWVYATWMGACTASLLGVVADRGSWKAASHGRSSCVCGSSIGPVALLPILGWLATRGRARCCGARIPVRYPACEAVLACAWGSAAAVTAALASSTVVALLGFGVAAATAASIVLTVLRRLA